MDRRYFKKSLSLLECYDITKDNLEDIDFLWDDIKGFSNRINPMFPEIPSPKRNQLSKRDILDITYDFYKSLDPVFFKYFITIFRQRRDFLTFENGKSNDDFLGKTLFIKSKNETFIRINRFHNLEDVFTMVHEYSHATSVQINPKHLSYPKDIYGEIDSLFMELILADYLEALMKDGEATFIKASELEYAHKEAHRIVAKINLIESERFIYDGYASNQLLLNSGKVVCNLNSNQLRRLLDPNDNPEVHVTSFMFALQLYRLYKIDKEKALYILRQIILLECLSKEEYYCNIKRFGIIPNLGLQEFQNDLTDDIMRLVRKKTEPKEN